LRPNECDTWFDTKRIQ